MCLPADAAAMLEYLEAVSGESDFLTFGPGEFELTDAISGMIAAHHRIAGLEIQGRWVDVRDPEVLAALQNET